MTDRQCSSCGGFCKKSGCKRENVKPEPEPVAYLCENAVGHKYFRWKKPSSEYKPIALYTPPPQREWVGLTDEELSNLEPAMRKEGAMWAAAKLKEKNYEA